MEEQRAILAADRSNNYLDTSKLEALFPGIDNIKVAVRKCLIDYKDNNKKINDYNEDMRRMYVHMHQKMQMQRNPDVANKEEQTPL